MKNVQEEIIKIIKDGFNCYKLSDKIIRLILKNPKALEELKERWGYKK